MSTDHIGQSTAEGAGGTELKIAAATTSVRYYSVAPGYRPQRPQRPRHRLHPRPRAVRGREDPDLLPAPRRVHRRSVRTSNIWDNIDNGEYVSDAYVRTGSDGYVAVHCS